jgi:hypothetical protein
LVIFFPESGSTSGLKACLPLVPAYAGFGCFVKRSLRRQTANRLQCPYQQAALMISNSWEEVKQENPAI